VNLFASILIKPDHPIHKLLKMRGLCVALKEAIADLKACIGFLSVGKGSHEFGC